MGECFPGVPKPAFRGSGAVAGATEFRLFRGSEIWRRPNFPHGGESTGGQVQRAMGPHSRALNSAEGQVAHRLADAGGIRDLASCDMPGWEPTRDGLCLVRPYKGKTFGWRLPRDAK